ncbi:hypothetical protein REJC140_00140 [Pseudorhizobium endolithicum]|uniref:DUF3263 domain-containing protein n=1 Tax=Pseudorhizobium endolithicum TaxID=1191678 RepID=A0ABM8PCN9_9HYPH|nr:hypothetical protein [Pseudorhizobium endolithicum]CAD7023241.1 hypothetical protein REJC140_00140 [Pseudorhizobium endolithicum]
MTLLQALAQFGPDTIAISKAMGIPEHEADRLINAEMDRRYRISLIDSRKAYNRRVRQALQDLRARRPA